MESIFGLGQKLALKGFQLLLVAFFWSIFLFWAKLKSSLLIEIIIIKDVNVNESFSDNPSCNNLAIFCIVV